MNNGQDEKHTRAEKKLVLEAFDTLFNTGGG
jgi:hypothetical protein